MSSKVTLKTWFKESAIKLKDAGIETYALDARMLLCHHLGISFEQMLSDSNREINDNDVISLKELVARRIKKEPVAQIVGVKEFWGMPFYVDGSTLTPRPDSETLVEVVLSLIGKEDEVSILDVGTGTGCLTLAILSERQKVRAVAVDLNKDTLFVAQKNAKRLKLEDRCDFALSDVFKDISGQFDLIISNPPYIPTNDIAGLADDVKKYDPMLALDGGKDGLDYYKRIFSGAKEVLKNDGKIIVELGYGQLGGVGKIASDCGFKVLESRKDLAGVDRVLVCGLYSI